MLVTVGMFRQWLRTMAGMEVGIREDMCGCPIARFLQAQGLPNPLVGEVLHVGAATYPLTEIARAFIDLIDDAGLWPGVGPLPGFVVRAGEALEVLDQLHADDAMLLYYES